MSTSALLTSAAEARSAVLLFLAFSTGTVILDENPPIQPGIRYLTQRNIETEILELRAKVILKEATGESWTFVVCFPGRPYLMSIVSIQRSGRVKVVPESG